MRGQPRDLTLVGPPFCVNWGVYSNSQSSSSSLMRMRERKIFQFSKGPFRRWRAASQSSRARSASELPVYPGSFEKQSGLAALAARRIADASAQPSPQTASESKFG